MHEPIDERPILGSSDSEHQQFDSHAIPVDENHGE